MTQHIKAVAIVVDRNPLEWTQGQRTTIDYGGRDAIVYVVDGLIESIFGRKNWDSRVALIKRGWDIEPGFVNEVVMPFEKASSANDSREKIDFALKHMFLSNASRHQREAYEMQILQSNVTSIEGNRRNVPNVVILIAAWNTTDEVHGPSKQMVHYPAGPNIVTTIERYDEVGLGAIQYVDGFIPPSHPNAAGSAKWNDFGKTIVDLVQKAFDTCDLDVSSTQCYFDESGVCGSDVHFNAKTLETEKNVHCVKGPVTIECEKGNDECMRICVEKAKSDLQRCSVTCGVGIVAFRPTATAIDPFFEHCPWDAIARGALRPCPSSEPAPTESTESDEILDASSHHEDVPIAWGIATIAVIITALLAMLSAFAIYCLCIRKKTRQSITTTSTPPQSSKARWWERSIQSRRRSGRRTPSPRPPRSPRSPAFKSADQRSGRQLQALSPLPKKAKQPEEQDDRYDILTGNVELNERSRTKASPWPDHPTRTESEQAKKSVALSTRTEPEKSRKSSPMVCPIPKMHLPPPPLVTLSQKSVVSPSTSDFSDKIGKTGSKKPVTDVKL